MISVHDFSHSCIIPLSGFQYVRFPDVRGGCCSGTSRSSGKNSLERSLLYALIAVPVLPDRLSSL